MIETYILAPLTQYEIADGIASYSDVLKRPENVNFAVQEAETGKGKKQDEQEKNTITVHAH